MRSYLQPKLRRSVNLPMLVFYGLGNIFGAGIYVLVGKIAGIAGIYAPLSFIVACIVVFFTALSYAELCARYPLSAGEAVYVNEGFRVPWLSTLVGLMIAFSGLFSAAAILHGFYGYLNSIVVLPESAIILILVATLGVIAIWGIQESMFFVFILTLIEMLGLGMVIYAGFQYIQIDQINFISLAPPLEFSVLHLIIPGAFLAFYAFIGFEDMVNIAEEVKEPTKVIPKAIIITLVIVTFVYVSVVCISIFVMPIDALAQSSAPLKEVYENATGSDGTILSVIAMVAVINGALIQIIMVSRIFYGMGSQGWLPKFLTSVNDKTRTPIASIVVTVGFVFILVNLFELVTLAQFTSFFIFVVFTLVNLSLVFIKHRKPYIEGIKVYPVAIPIIAIIFNLILLGFQVISMF
jgi:basic amino acid/polyamine antiporter, APA family